MDIIVFGSSSLQGRNLARLLQEVIPSTVSEITGLDQSGISMEIIFPGDFRFGQLFFYRYQLSADLVIFDASIELEEDGLTHGENYACAPHAPYMEENVLVVSRTVLPLNFIPHTTNVLPIGEDWIRDASGLRFIRMYDNRQDIVPWVIRQLKERNQDGRLLKTEEKVRLGKGFDPVKKAPNLFRHDGRKVAFISYRSFYNEPNRCGSSSVQDLERTILEYHRKTTPGEDWRVLFYPPGSLSQDCPTENLRWSLMSFIENVFIDNDVEEVWIFNSDGRDEYSYWDSWFTQGEFISLMLINQGLKDHMPRVFMYDPHTWHFGQLDDLPSLSESARTELSAILTNSDNLWGDRAALKKTIWVLDHMHEFSFAQRVSLKLSELLTRARIKASSGLKVASYADMSRLHAYSPGFLTNRVFTCKHCMLGGFCIQDFNNESFIADFIHIGDDHSEEWRNRNQHRGFFVVDESDFHSCLAKGYVECPNCHSHLAIKRAPEQDFFLWQRYLPNSPYMDSFIERVEAYNVVE